MADKNKTRTLSLIRTMAGHPSARGAYHHPSVPEISDTHYASPATAGHSSPPAGPPLPPAARPARSQSLASQTSQPIRRKPLSATAASSLAVSYLSRDHVQILHHPPPENSFARPFSVDSPTLYEFPESATALGSHPG